MGGAVSIEQKNNTDDNINNTPTKKVIESYPEIDTIFNYYENIYNIGNNILAD